jgi:hypothetical protein
MHLPGETRLPFIVLVPPTIWLSPKKDLLEWRPWGNENEGRYKIANPPKDILYRFCELAKASRDEILAFARQYGVLGLCKHGLPLHHRSKIERLRRTGERKKTLLRTVEGCDLYLREPIQSWVGLAQAAEALIQLKTNARTGAWPAGGWLAKKRHTWKRITSQYLDQPHIRLGRIPLEDRLNRLPQRDKLQIISDLVTDWLAVSAVRPTLTVVGEELRFTFLADTLGFPNLFGVLAVALAAEMSSRAKMVRCDGTSCAKWCELSPNASLHRRHYCPKCRRDNHYQARAAAQRDLRANMREAKRLDRQGRSLPEIAAKLNRSVDRIRKWVEKS